MKFFVFFIICKVLFWYWWWLWVLGYIVELIKKYEEFVLSLWDEFNWKIFRKKCKLKDFSDFYKFNNEVIVWCWKYFLKKDVFFVDYSFVFVFDWNFFCIFELFWLFGLGFVIRICFGCCDFILNRNCEYIFIFVKLKGYLLVIDVLFLFVIRFGIWFYGVLIWVV